MVSAKMAGMGALVLVVVLGSATVFGAGLLVPTDTSLAPLAVKYLRVDTTIDNQVANTHVTQEFINSTSRPLECTYIFPLPKGAAVREFAMYIGGIRVEGELVDKDKARTVYEEIVRRTKDPGLLEYMDGGLLRMRVFPVPANGTQKVEVTYTELVKMDSGLAEYVFPLKTNGKDSKTLDDFTVSVRIKSEAEIKNVYSPSHEVGVTKPSGHEAVAGMEKKAATLDEDFRLFWSVSEKDFGLSLMTYRPDAGKPGMFLMLVSPKSELDKKERVARDVVFVFDTSGSMSGTKLDQAKMALKYCVNAVRPEDRFAIVQFSTMAQSYGDGWTAGTEEARKKACAWIDGQQAAGGTNIQAALELALGLPTDEKRPETILFLTDGQPTVAVTDVKQLADMVKTKNTRNLRVFTFGVGNDVNTHLLDLIAEGTGGLPAYVAQGEQVEAKVTGLFSKMTHPVMTALQIEAPGVKVVDMYPKDLPDLFEGSQVVIVGSYEKSGPTVIKLTGSVGGEKREFVYEGTFADKNAERSFIGAIYANRKIGYLLDQIRLHGESAELKNEVIRLSVLYGIQTPYTSYLVLENKAQYAQYGVEVGKAGAPGAPNYMSGGAMRAANDGDIKMRREQVVDKLESTFKQSAGEATPSPRSIAGFTENEADMKKADVGQKAVDVANEVQRMRNANTKQAGQNNVANNSQQRGNRQVANYRGVWVDENFQGTEKVTKVKWGSNAYFRLAREHKDLREIFTLGQRAVVVTARNQAVAVEVDDGVADLDDAQAKALFTDM